MIEFIVCDFEIVYFDFLLILKFLIEVMFFMGIKKKYKQVVICVDDFYVFKKIVKECLEKVQWDELIQNFRKIRFYRSIYKVFLLLISYWI